MFDESLSQEEVLVIAPGRGSRWALDGTGLAELELLARQIKLNAAGQLIPPMKAVLLSVVVDLADHEVAAEEVIDD